MRIHINSDYSLASERHFRITRGDSLNLEIFFLNADCTVGRSHKIDNLTIRFGAKPKGDYQCGGFLVYTDQFVLRETTLGNPYYDAPIHFNSEALSDLLGNDDYVSLIAELELKIGSLTMTVPSRQLELQIHNDVIKGGEGLPVPVPAYVTQEYVDTELQRSIDEHLSSYTNHFEEVSNRMEKVAENVQKSETAVAGSAEEALRSASDAGVYAGQSRQSRTDAEKCVLLSVQAADLAKSEAGLAWTWAEGEDDFPEDGHVHRSSKIWALESQGYCNVAHSWAIAAEEASNSSEINASGASVSARNAKASETAAANSAARAEAALAEMKALTIGAVTTLPPGSQATASITNGKLNLGLVAGPKGDTGEVAPDNVMIKNPDGSIDVAAVNFHHPNATHNPDQVTSIGAYLSNAVCLSRNPYDATRLQPASFIGWRYDGTMYADGYWNMETICGNVSFVEKVTFEERPVFKNGIENTNGIYYTPSATPVQIGAVTLTADGIPHTWLYSDNRRDNNGGNLSALTINETGSPYDAHLYLGRGVGCVVMTGSSFEMRDKRIRGLAPGISSTDAVNLTQTGESGGSVLSVNGHTGHVQIGMGTMSHPEDNSVTAIYVYARQKDQSVETVADYGYMIGMKGASAGPYTQCLDFTGFDGEEHLPDGVITTENINLYAVTELGGITGSVHLGNALIMGSSGLVVDLGDYRGALRLSDESGNNIIKYDEADDSILVGLDNGSHSRSVVIVSNKCDVKANSFRFNDSDVLTSESVINLEL